MLHRPSSFVSFPIYFAYVLEQKWQQGAKRPLDVVLAICALLLLSPALLLIASLVKLTSRGPVFFRQRRIGASGQIFEILKFRTMYDNSPGQDGTIQAVTGDCRVTKVGAFLRRWSLDELPQLFNVVRGDMSMVGPRPHPVQMMVEGQPFEQVVTNYSARHLVRPGITGWAQVNGWRGETSTVDKAKKRVEFDLYYIANWTILLDLKILAMTIPAVLTGRNAV
jgi:putative colanic acid biosynthesis UDP-glucose lipid carrier transferase